MSFERDKGPKAVDLITVPRIPTRAMLEAAYWAALNEDAEAVWDSMIASWIQSNKGKSDSGSL
jgi:hypothetical protein